MLKNLFCLFGLSLCVVTGAAYAQDQNQDPAPHWRDDPASCRAMTEALLRNRITDATDAVVPDNATQRLRKNIRALMHRFSAGLAEGAANRPAEFERVMPDADLDGHKVSMESWYFGDELFVVGCIIRPNGRSANISIQAYPSVQDVLEHMKDSDDDDTIE